MNRDTLPEMVKGVGPMISVRNLNAKMTEPGLQACSGTYWTELSQIKHVNLGLLSHTIWLTHLKTY